MTGWSPPLDAATLADRADARHRQAERHVDATRFATVRDRVEGGFEWGVGGLATDAAGRILLVAEDGRWLLPGGVVEAGESLETALVREVAEETGMTVTVGSLLSVTEQAVVHESERVAFQFAIFEIDPSDAATAPASGEDGIDAVAWHETLPSTTLDRKFIRTLCDR